MASSGKDSAADLTSTSTLLDQPSVNSGVSDASGVVSGRASEAFSQPDKRFSCPGMDSTMGHQFDVPGRQSMAGPLPAHKKKNNERLPSQLGHDSVEFPAAYSQSPAAKVRCGIGSFFKRK